jgi:hypothetical protein
MYTNGRVEAAVFHFPTLSALHLLILSSTRPAVDQLAIGKRYLEGIGPTSCY